MGARNASRVWLFTGAAVIVLLVAASYLLLIRPKYTESSSVRAQVDDTQVQLATLRRKIADLAEQQKHLPTFKAALIDSRLALPTTAGVSDFLRQLQRAGDQVDVAVNGISVAVPMKSTVAPEVWELPITLNAEGAPAKLSLFLTQLQTAQARAVLVKSVNFVGGASSTAANVTPPSISLSITAYVAPPASAGVPIVTTK